MTFVLCSNCSSGLIKMETRRATAQGKYTPPALQNTRSPATVQVKTLTQAAALPVRNSTSKPVGLSQENWELNFPTTAAALLLLLNLKAGKSRDKWILHNI